MNKTLKLGLLAAAIATSGSAYAEDAKIAFLGGFTGPLESLTPPIYAGAKLAIDQVNAQGGNITLLKGDSTCADATAATVPRPQWLSSAPTRDVAGLSENTRASRAAPR